MNGATPRFGEWARAQLGSLVQRYFATLPADHTDRRALHQFRIQGKELRYAMEILGGVFPDSLRKELYPIIESIQDRLGSINDVATAIAWLEKEMAHSRNTNELTAWKRLLAREEAKFEQQRQQFWEWCTPQLLQDLRAGFEALHLGQSQRKKSRQSLQRQQTQN